MLSFIHNKIFHNKYRKLIHYLPINMRYEIIKRGDWRGGEILIANYFLSFKYCSSNIILQILSFKKCPSNIVLQLLPFKYFLQILSFKCRDQDRVYGELQAKENGVYLLHQGLQKKVFVFNL